MTRRGGRAGLTGNNVLSSLSKTTAAAAAAAGPLFLDSRDSSPQISHVRGRRGAMKEDCLSYCI